MSRFAAAAALASSAALALVGALTLAGTAAAHHSGAMFDTSREVTLVGSIRQFRWTNPHAWIEIDASGAEGAQSVTWAIEMQPPNMLIRRGWTRSSLKPGDRVTMVVNPLRDGAPGGTFVRVTLPDGGVLED